MQRRLYGYMGYSQELLVRSLVRFSQSNIHRTRLQHKKIPPNDTLLPKTTSQTAQHTRPQGQEHRTPEINFVKVRRGRIYVVVRSFFLSRYIVLGSLHVDK